MPEIITLGETMAVMSPNSNGALGSVESFALRIAGAESNTAIGVARLGHTAGWISALGKDALGSFVLEKIKSEGVDTSRCIIDEKHRTGLMIKEFCGGKTTVYYYRDNSAASHYSTKYIDYDYVKSARIIHLTGITPVLSRGCIESVNDLANTARENNILLSVDPNLRKKIWGETDFTPYIKKLLELSDIALLGLNEAQEIFGINTPGEVIEHLLSKGVKYVAVKDGDKGATVADKTGIYYIPPIPCNSIDPVGAGDGFNAGFLSGILSGFSVDKCGRMGGVVGAMATETNGDVDGYPTREQLKERLKEEI